MVRLFDSSSSDEEQSYVSAMDSLGQVSPLQCSEYLEYWNQRRAEIGQNGDLTEQEKTGVNHVLDQFQAAQEG